MLYNRRYALYRADCHAVTAVLAFDFVNYIETAVRAFCNSTFWAFCFAGSASDTFVSVYSVGHFRYPFVASVLNFEIRIA